MLQIFISTALFVAVVSTATDQSKKPQSTVSRTELKVSRSLNPDDMQTLNVMTRDGNVAQLIVKRRDAKSKGASPLLSEVHQDIYNGYRSLFQDFKSYGEYKPDYQLSKFDAEENYQQLENKQQEIQYPKTVVTNWIPIQSVYYQPNIVRLDSIAMVRNVSKPYTGPLGNVIDSDRCNINFIIIIIIK